MDVPRSKAKVGVPGYVIDKTPARSFINDVPRYIVWGNTRARYILWAGYIYAWFVHGLIWVDPDRAYIMHARADESTEHNRLDYYWTFYGISVALNCAHHEWVTVHLLPITRTVLSLSKLSSLRVIVGVPGYMYPGTRTLECKLAKKGPESIARAVGPS